VAGLVVAGDRHLGAAARVRAAQRGQRARAQAQVVRACVAPDLQQPVAGVRLRSCRRECICTNALTCGRCCRMSRCAGSLRHPHKRIPSKRMVVGNGHWADNYWLHTVLAVLRC
jgi:hypothetical protein